MSDKWFEELKINVEEFLKTASKKELEEALINSGWEPHRLENGVIIGGLLPYDPPSEIDILKDNLAIVTKERDEARERIAFLEKTFTHSFDATGVDADFCHKCGLNIRDAVHRKVSGL